MNVDRDLIETNLRLHVDRLAGLIGVRTLKRPKTILATIGYIEGQWSEAKSSQTVPSGIPQWMHRFFPQRGNFLAAVGNLPSWKLCWQFRRGFKRGTRRMPLFSICLPEKIHEIRLSDNSSFWDQGYSALMLTDTSYLQVLVGDNPVEVQVLSSALVFKGFSVILFPVS